MEGRPPFVAAANTCCAHIKYQGVPILYPPGIYCACWKVDEKTQANPRPTTRNAATRCGCAGACNEDCPPRVAQGRLAAPVAWWHCKAVCKHIPGAAIFTAPQMQAPTAFQARAFLSWCEGRKRSHHPPLHKAVAEAAKQLQPYWRAMLSFFPCFACTLC